MGVDIKESRTETADGLFNSLRRAGRMDPESEEHRERVENQPSFSSTRTGLIGSVEEYVVEH